MLQKWETAGTAAQREEGMLVDGIVYRGIDTFAARRAHMRELTTARQAAEQHYTQAVATHRNGSVPLIEVRERAVELRVELDRIDAAHRSWLHEQGEDVAPRRTRRHKMPGTARQK